MYLARTPALVKPLMKELTWSMPVEPRTVYLTFDDGPIPDVTPWVLDTLAEHGAKATFFCVGQNAAAHPHLLERIRTEGHSVGNHTYDHLSGWSTSTFGYLRNVARCQSLTGSRLFRPPYGRITRQQARALRKRYTLVMWDVLSADFDPNVDGERCFRNVQENAAAGSIVVFHDSLKAEASLRHALPRTLARFAAEGYTMAALPEDLFTAPGR